MKLRVITSGDELARWAPAWDDLWRRSPAALPEAQVAHLLLWLRCFAPGRTLHCLTVEDSGRLVAALPLVAGRRLGAAVAMLPTNDWSLGAELLLDPEVEPCAALDQLAAAVARCGDWLVDLPGIDLSSPRWQDFLAALARRGLAALVSPRFEAGRVRLASGWEDYLASRSRNLRRQMRVASARAENAGGVELALHVSVEDGEVDSLVRRALAVEQRGWKGAAGTAVLRRPGLAAFFVAQARLLAARGQLCVVFLEHAGQPIAFELGQLSGGVYYPVKVGYDPAYERLTPGQLLRWRLFEQMIERGACRLVDFAGPISAATARWANERYTVARARVPTERLGSRALASLARRWRAFRALASARSSPALPTDVEPPAVEPDLAESALSR